MALNAELVSHAPAVLCFPSSVILFSPHFSPTICTRDAFQVRRHRPVRQGFIRDQRKSRTSWILLDSLPTIEFSGTRLRPGS
ncbi:hypothetical protein BDV24DRAFT_125458 [Aspergillus arachidicola]|uniref:Uncharacterized protein n=1 Tax=Aspergillus arachidicola TaxID=656916 RepID=A0A5N6YKS6_9EURO|nr:hypothetical protein BDV24DRAFT_125458 [Aspergillus arachidicola]